MDQATLTAIFALFLVCLPSCLFCATFGVLSAGYLTQAEDQPFSFRVFVWMMSSRRQPSSAETASPAGVLAALLLLGVANFVPVFGLVTHKNGVGPIVATLVYFVAVAAWAANVIRAIRRTRSRDRTTRGR
jgi:hypothetical protein